jgi:hypothetical protein
VDPFRSFLQHSRFHFQQKGVGLALSTSRKQFSRRHSRNSASALPSRIGKHLANDKRIRAEGQSIRSPHRELRRRMLCPLMQLTAGAKHFVKLAEQLHLSLK